VGFGSDGADGHEVQVLNEKGLWADGQVRHQFVHVCVPQVILSSSCLPLIDSVFICAAVNFDFVSFADYAMLVSILQERYPFRYILIMR
jgi:hypothetical protein